MRMCSGCQTKVADNVRICSACRAERSNKPNDGIREHSPSFEQSGVYDAELDELRKGKRWKYQMQPSIIRRDPICKRCDTAMSAIVDHIVPAAIAILQARESKRWPLDKYAGYFLTCNLQGLCRACHAAKTAEDKEHQGPWPNVVELYDAAPKKKWTFG